MTVTRPHAIGDPGYSETWPSEPETASRARKLIRAAMNTWKLDSDVVERALLIISELVTNSILHSGCHFLRVSVTRIEPGTVRLAVSDKSRKKPEIRGPGLSDETGRGLVLVDSLADAWNVEMLSFGKTVFADLFLKVPD